MSGQVYGAVYSGIPVFEMNCRQVAVMRRRADSYLNATQILKVAGVDKGRRTKILEREVQVGEHEKVQGGYGKYQGTWIPFERGVEVARQYGVEELLRPLFEFQPGPDDELDVPRKINRRPSKPKYDEVDESPKLFPTRKKMTSDGADYGAVSNYGYYPAQVPVRPPPTNAERYRAILMSIFLNHDGHKLPDLITNPNPPADLDIDLIIDDQGHTSLHWAAALARINVLQYLLKLGADPRRVNFNGESALIRAVLVTNNFDNDSFVELLSMIPNAIDITDKKGRSVLHHIALTAGIKGRLQASRYYLETLVDAMLKGGYDLTALIDLQDKNGDTTLNIAARIGNRNLVEHLLRHGADPELPNRAGLRPVDFGLEDARLASLFQSKIDLVAQGNVADLRMQPTVPDCVFGIKQAKTHVPGSVGELQKLLADKESQMHEALLQIRNLSDALNESRKAVQQLSHRVAELEMNNKQLQPDGESCNAPCADSDEREIVRLRALLAAHGIPANEDGNSDLMPLDSKLTQLVAQVLNMPVSAITPGLIDPLLAAVNSDSSALDLSEIEAFLRQKADSASLVDKHAEYLPESTLQGEQLAPHVVTEMEE